MTTPDTLISVRFGYPIPGDSLLETDDNRGRIHSPTIYIHDRPVQTSIPLVSVPKDDSGPDVVLKKQS